MIRHVFSGAGGAALAADVLGKGPSVVMLHGGGQTRGSWRRTAVDLVDQGYSVVALDARGHGESDWSATGYGFDLFVGDLLRVLDDIDGIPALIGASLGGLTSLLAVGETDRTIASALVLVDIVPRFEVKGSAAIQAFMTANPDGFESVEAAADAVGRYMPNRPRPQDLSGLRRNLREGSDGRLRWHWDPALMSGPVPDLDAMLARLEAASARISVPTLMVRGERSEIVSDESVAHFQNLMPEAEIVEVAGAAHMVAGDANTPFADAVLTFLKRVYPV